MTVLNLAKHDDLQTLLPMVADFYAELHAPKSTEYLREALLPLLEGSPYGVAYLAGPKTAPVGYAILTFSWSVELGGMDGMISEIYIQPEMRGRGIGTELLTALPEALQGSRLKVLQLKLDPHNESALKHYSRMQFQVREHQIIMSRPL